MRLHYILRTSDRIDGGICKKIKFQIRNLKDLGVEVLLHDYPEIHNCLYVKKNNNLFLNIFLKLKREYSLNIKLIDLIKISNKDDILYLRYVFPSLMLLRIFKKQRKCKIVMEYQSIEIFEYLSQNHLIYAFIELVFGGAIIRNSDAIIGVTDEITQYEIKRSGRQNIKFITIGNGFDVNSVNVREPPKFSQNELSILCVAHVSIWHGYDRLITGIAAYSGPLPVKLHIAGTGKEIPHLKKMVERYGLNDKVIFHSWVSGKSLDDLFNQCHVAVGSLGLHRIRLKEASILKVREYCSRGIPFIVAYSDPDFSDDFPYIQKVPADDTPISIDDAVQFATLVYKDMNHPQKMHDYAVKYLDWSVKMKNLKFFLENLVY